MRRLYGQIVTHTPRRHTPDNTPTVRLQHSYTTYRRHSINMPTVRELEHAELDSGATVKQDGLMLQYAAEPVKADFDIVLAAV